MVLLHGHLQIKLFEAHDVGRAFYSKKSIIKSICKGLAQNAKQAIQKQKHADRDCYVAVYAGMAGADSAYRALPKQLSGASGKIQAKLCIPYLH